MRISLDLGMPHLKVSDKLTKCGKRSAFTTAEMLIVLLIISFLVIALPPLTNKRVEKKIRRGEHGRYECFMKPVTSGGQTKLHLVEYLATEHGGAMWGANGRDLGEVDANGVAEDGRCRFRPQEMAPTASYFVMHLIGGGGGGGFPPYDGSSTYKANRADNNNIVKILFEPLDTSYNTYMHSGSK